MYINLAYRISLINIGTSFKKDCNLNLSDNLLPTNNKRNENSVGENHCSADIALVTARPKDTMKTYTY